jgi:3-oxoacyl-[acyl-carrier-protein] synthase-3
MRNAVISGSGSYLPQRILSNQELETVLDTTHEWIYARTGISRRHIAENQETTSWMAGKAAARALESSGLSADQIDMILVATCTPDHFFPSMAAHVQAALQIKKPVPAFDISVACSGFVYAMDVARQYIFSGAARHILVIGSESMSKGVDWTDRSVCILFGDGAGAVVLSADESRSGILGSAIHSTYDADRLLAYRNATSLDEKVFISMRGNEVFKIAVNIMTDIVDEVLNASGLKKSDIKWLVPHQANIRIIQAIAKKLDLPMSQVIVTIEDQGNTSAASIPLALDCAIRDQRIQRGDLILLESFGGGMSWGAMVIEY